MTQNAVTQPVPGLSGQTSTLALLAELRSQSQRPLEFHLRGERLVPAGYHVTEVKAVTVEAMDCGGRAASWHETVIQLMDGSAEEARAGWMTNRKFLAIYDRVARHIPVRQEAEVRFEYGHALLPALQYHVRHIEGQPGRVVIHLDPPRVQCKASTDAASGAGCCSPAPISRRPSR